MQPVIHACFVKCNPQRPPAQFVVIRLTYEVMCSLKMLSLNLNPFKSDFKHTHYYIKRILYSGLVLDEDVDCIFNYYKYRKKENQSRGVNAVPVVVGSGVCIAGVFFWIYKNVSPVWALRGTLPVVTILTMKCINSVKDANYIRGINQTIRDMKEIIRINPVILKFLQKKSLEEDSCALLNPNDQIGIIREIIREEIDFLLALTNYITQLGEVIPVIKKDYSYVNDLCTGFSPRDESSIEECIDYQMQICDLCTLIISNLLTCLALSLCSNLWPENPMNTILTIISSVKKNTLHCLQTVQHKFNELKYHFLLKPLEKLQIKKQTEVQPNNLFYSQASNAMNQANAVVAKSRLLFQLLQRKDPEACLSKEAISVCINHLMQETDTYYNNLSMLHNLYLCSDSNSPKTEKDLVVQEKKREIAEDLPEMIDVVNECIDSLVDDEYELFITDEDSRKEEKSSYKNEDEVNKFAPILAQELKSALKTHSRFNNARTKRNLKDEDPIEKAGPSNPDKIIAEPSHQISTGVPLPPPIPNLSIESEIDLEETAWTARIKSESKRFNLQEEIFQQSQE